MGEFILNGRNYGGSIITPNPSDTPTDTLDSIKIDDTTYEIQGGGGGSNLILDAQKYSLEEEVVGIWRDGKPLYQKTWQTTAVTGRVVDLSGVNVENLIYEDAFILSSDGQNITPHGGGSFVIWYRTATSGGNPNNCIMCTISNSAYNNGTMYVTLQYTKTTDVAGSGGYQAYGFSPIIYSDVERQVGVWRDNKPLYQKTIDIGTLPNASQKLVNHNISDFGEAVRVFGYARNTSNNAIIPLPHNHPNAVNQSVSLIVTTTQISVQTGVDRSGYVGFVTVQYTKASDVAGSGDYNTLAIPNVHYSTDEQVVGTWFRETLYQKVFEIDAFPNATTTSYNPNISNFKEWICAKCSCELSFTSGNKASLPYINTNYATGYNITWQLNTDGTFQITAQSDRRNVSGIAILYYTKTTD